MSDTGKKKKISIGVEDFKEIIIKDGYFVDKTLMIKELLESNVKVTLFTRPRRFGKTLNQFMIRRFFEDEITEKGEKVDNGNLFDGLKITECGEGVMCHQRQYLVIFITMKSGKQPEFGMAYRSLVDEISHEFIRHRYVLQSDKLLPAEKECYENLMNRRADSEEVAKAFDFLSECLYKYHDKNTIILIDEYDVPLENAYFEGFYDKMIKFIRAFFESAPKTNPYLFQVVWEKIEKADRSSLIHALETGDCEAAENFLNEQLLDTISYFDYAESYYHGFMTGILNNAGRYRVYSNRESGNGRPDIVLTELRFMGRAIILELKISDTFRGMEKKCEEALAQIEEQKYAVPLEDDGYQEILKYAICFFKKGCIVRKAEQRAQ